MKRKLHAAMSCVSLIGMPASGKSTLGRRLAELTGLAHVDSDHVIESVYGVCLQDVANALGKEAFLDMEGAVVSTLQMSRAVLSTGGSVVYREGGMQRLAELGPILHIDVGLDVILERIARKPDRGLAIAPGQTVEDLYTERCELYRHWADFTLNPNGRSPDECAEELAAYVRELKQKGWFCPEA